MTENASGLTCSPLSMAFQVRRIDRLWIGPTGELDLWSLPPDEHLETRGKRTTCQRGTRLHHRDISRVDLLRRHHGTAGPTGFSATTEVTSHSTRINDRRRNPEKRRRRQATRSHQTFFLESSQAQWQQQQQRRQRQDPRTAVQRALSEFSRRKGSEIG